MPAATFSYDGSHVFLTYPQCPLEREQLRDWALSVLLPTKYYIARELHDDGGYHLHCYFAFGRRRRFVGADCFDVDGYHPNVQKPRSAKNVVAYCSKEDATPLANFAPGEMHGEGGWGELLERCGSKDEFLEGVRLRFPRDYVLSLERLLAFCEWKFGREHTSYTGRIRTDFVEPPTLTDWVLTNLSEVRALRAGPSALEGGPSPLLSNPLCLYWLICL